MQISERMQELAGIPSGEGYIFEGGLARIWQKTNTPFSIITAFRANLSIQQNRDRNRQLESDLKSIRAGGIKLTGHWAEAPDDMDWKEAHKLGLTDDTVEDSYFVPMPSNMNFGEFKDFIYKLTKKYSQDGVVLSDGIKTYLLWQNGTMDVLGTKVSFGKVAQGYSAMRGKPKKTFVFEGTVEPSSIAHRMIMQQRGLSWASKIVEHDSTIVKDNKVKSVSVIFDGPTIKDMSVEMVIDSDDGKSEQWRVNGTYDHVVADKLAKQVGAKAKRIYIEDSEMIEIRVFGSNSTDLYFATEKMFGHKLKKVK